MNTAKRLSKTIKSAQYNLQRFNPITKTCTQFYRNIYSKIISENICGYYLLTLFLCMFIVPATHGSSKIMSTDAATKQQQPPPIISLDKQQSLHPTTNFIQVWQHGEAKPTAKQWLSFSPQDWKQAKSNQTNTHHKYFRLTLFNVSNETLPYTYQNHTLSDNTFSVTVIARASLRQLNHFLLTDTDLQILKTSTSKVTALNLLPGQVVILAIFSEQTYLGTPASMLQSQKDFNHDKEQTNKLALFISGALLTLLFLYAINIFSARTYISTIGCFFALPAILTHSSVKPLVFWSLLPTGISANLIFTAKLLSFIAFVAIITWMLAKTQHSKSIPKKYFYAAGFLALAVGLGMPQQSQTILLPINLCVSFACFYFAVLAYFKYPQYLGALFITFINFTTAIILLWLNKQYLNGHISADRHTVFSMTISAVNIANILTLLLYIIREQQAFLSDRMRDAIKQEQKIATLSPLIHASRHDLRAPLSDIIGLAELISDHPLDQQQRKSIYSIQSVAKNALSNINRIFSYQSNTQNTLAPYRQKSTFYLTDLISECTNFYGHYFSESEQELIIDLAENLPNHLVGEHELLRQIFMHIIEYLAIHIGNTDACINIQFDEKKGLLIAHTLANKLLKKHNNLPNQLQLIKTLSKKIRGHFYINDTRQQVNLTLPMEVVESTNQSSDMHLLTTGKRVLVVDDNPTSCNVISTYLQRWGIKVYTANDLSETQAIVRHQKTLNHSIDLAIVDYLLTNATGLDLVKKLFEDPQINNLMPIIIMSNAPDLIDTTQAKNYGIRHILEKPVLAETLKALVLEEFHLQQTLRIDIEDSNQQQAKPFNKRFLLVEDSPISAKILTTMLDRLSINYDHAQTAAEALSLFYKHHYSLILLDCELPDDTGFSVTTKMRAHEASVSGQTIIIALSADNSDEYKERALQAGMNEFIAKPLSLDHLDALIKKHEQ